MASLPTATSLAGPIYLEDVHSILASSASSHHRWNQTIWYDEVHEHLLILEQQQQHTFQIREILLPDHQKKKTIGEKDENNGNNILLDFIDPLLIPSGTSSLDTTTTYFINVKLSVNRAYLAMQKSDIEIQIEFLRGEEEKKVQERKSKGHFVLGCRPRAGNRILKNGILWAEHGNGNSLSTKQDLYLVTTYGLEIYVVKESSCRLSSTLAYNINMHWYCAPRRILLLGSTGKESSVLRPYFLAGLDAPQKIPKMIMSDSVVIGPEDLKLIIIYKTMYAVHIHLEKAKLCLYKIISGGMIYDKSCRLNLPDSGEGLDLGVVDNLLVCYSREFGVCQFYDIMQDSLLIKPFIHPLPVGHTITDISIGDTREKSESSPNQPIFNFISSRLTIQVDPISKATHFREVRLNLHEIQRCASRHDDFIPFLLRRKNISKAKYILLDLLFLKLMERPSLSSFKEIMNQIHQGYKNEGQDKIVHQMDCYNKVWLPAYKNPDIDREFLLSCLCQYVFILLECGLKIEEDICLLMVNIYLDCNRVFELLQLLYCHRIFSDSLKFSSLLMAKAVDDSRFLQIGLDMLHRIGRFDMIVKYQLNYGKIYPAMRLALFQRKRVAATIELKTLFFQKTIEYASKKNSCVESELLMDILYSFYIRWGEAKWLDLILGHSSSPLAVQMNYHFPDDLFSQASSDKYRKLFGFPSNKYSSSKHII